FQARIVPAAEYLGDLASGKAEPVTHDAVDFGDHLHVGVFDAVVDGLDEMPRPLGADEGGARLALKFRRDGVEYLFDARPGSGRTAGHDRGALAGTLLASGHTDAEEIQTGLHE